MSDYVWWSTARRDDGGLYRRAVCGSFHLRVDDVGNGWTYEIEWWVDGGKPRPLGGGTCPSEARAREVLGSMMLPELERMTAFAKALVVPRVPWSD